MSQMMIFILKNSSRIVIPLSKIKEIKETTNKNICIVNGYKVRGNFEKLLRTILDIAKI